jgi:hypothetical protein
MSNQWHDEHGRPNWTILWVSLAMVVVIWCALLVLQP